MKKVSLTVVLVAACVLVFAQGAKTQEAKVHSMTGCLRAGSAPNSYELTDLEKGPKTVGIVSSSANLAPHVGHKIEITGTAVPAKEAEADPNVPKAAHYMKVDSIKMVSTTCP